MADTPTYDLVRAEHLTRNFCVARIKQLAPPESAPSTFYHHASAPAMKSIIASRALWAHNIEQQGDYIEARYAASVMAAHPDRAYASDTNEKVRALFKAMREYMGTIGLQTLFVTSFCERPDIPMMWNLYADRGRGFSLAVETHDVACWGGVITKCQYDPDVLDETCKWILQRVREVFIETGGLQSEANLPPYAETFVNNIAWFSPMFKPQVWADEQEWRILFPRTSEHHQMRDGDRRTYVAIPIFGLGGFAIRAICGGFACDMKADFRPLQESLQASGLHGVQMCIVNEHPENPMRSGR